MTSEEFDILLDAWYETPEYKKYKSLWLSFGTYDKRLEHDDEIKLAFLKAISNKYGKQLIKEDKFFKLFL